MQVLLDAMKTLDLVELTKLKMALVAPNRIIGVDYGSGHRGETDVAGDWRELRTSGHGQIVSLTNDGTNITKTVEQLRF